MKAAGRAPRFFALALIGLASFASSLAVAQSTYRAGPIERPSLQGLNRAALANRALAVQKSRNQRIKPVDQQQAVGRLTAMDVASAEFQQQIAIQPPQVRAQVFVQKSQEAGLPVDQHSRRVRGMLKSFGELKVSHASKRFIEVTGGNFELFHKVMGKNMVWFTVTEEPNHLHTLIKDQAGGERFHHNVYGVTTDEARLNSSNKQISMGVHLTDKQIDRLINYMNLGTQAESRGYQNRNEVFGFFARGNKVTDIKCTNWVTSAPIGELPRWVKTVDRRVSALAEGNSELAAVKSAGGLHAALAGAQPAEARAQLVQRVLGAPGLKKGDRKRVKQLAQAFDKILGAFPGRPGDMVLRQSMAETLGLSRSQDPAKWSYDLLMSKRVPVIALLNSATQQNAQRTFNWEIMGDLAPSGQMVAASRYGATNLGVIPPNQGGQAAPQ